MFISIDDQGKNPQGNFYIKGHFLILLRCESEPDLPLRALVRYIKMTQLGEFLRATNRVQGQALALVGTYGAHGAAKAVPKCLYMLGSPLPNQFQGKAEVIDQNALKTWAEQQLRRKSKAKG